MPCHVLSSDIVTFVNVCLGMSRTTINVFVVCLNTYACTHMRTQNRFPRCLPCFANANFDLLVPSFSCQEEGTPLSSAAQEFFLRMLQDFAQQTNGLTVSVHTCSREVVLQFLIFVCMCVCQYGCMRVCMTVIMKSFNRDAVQEFLVCFCLCVHACSCVHSLVTT